MKPRIPGYSRWLDSLSLSLSSNHNTAVSNEVARPVLGTLERLPVQFLRVWVRRASEDAHPMARAGDRGCPDDEQLVPERLEGDSPAVVEACPDGHRPQRPPRVASLHVNPDHVRGCLEGVEVVVHNGNEWWRVVGRDRRVPQHVRDELPLVLALIEHFPAGQCLLVFVLPPDHVEPIVHVAPCAELPPPVHAREAFPRLAVWIVSLGSPQHFPVPVHPNPARHQRVVPASGRGEEAPRVVHRGALEPLVLRQLVPVDEIIPSFK